MTSIRDYLKKLRANKNFTQKDVATRIGISSNYYNMIENEERQKKLNIDTIIKLAEVFNITLSEIISLETKKDF